MFVVLVLLLMLVYAVFAVVVSSSWDGVAGVALFLASLVVTYRLARCGVNGLIARTNQTYWDGVRDGLCPHCGYDKRVNPAGRCPECGLPLPPTE